MAADVRTGPGLPEADERQHLYFTAVPRSGLFNAVYNDGLLGDHYELLKREMGQLLPHDRRVRRSPQRCPCFLCCMRRRLSSACTALRHNAHSHAR